MQYSVSSLAENSLGIQSSSASSRIKIYIQLSASSPTKKIKSSDNEKHSKSSAYESYIERFLKAIRKGSVCVWDVCNRCLYKLHIVLFNKEQYNFEYIDRLVTDIIDFDYKHNICRTCDFKIKKSQVPCRAVHNKLYLDNTPKEISYLNHLELFVTCKRFLFLKK